MEKGKNIKKWRQGGLLSRSKTASKSIKLRMLSKLKYKVVVKHSPKKIKKSGKGCVFIFNI